MVQLDSVLVISVCVLFKVFQFNKIIPQKECRPQVPNECDRVQGHGRCPNTIANVGKSRFCVVPCVGAWLQDCLPFIFKDDLMCVYGK